MNINSLSKKVLFLFIASVLLYIFSMFWSISVDREMYLDGSNFFSGILSKDSTWPYWNDDWHNRIFINLLNQFILVLGLKLGVTNLNFLKFLYGFGLFFTSFLIYVHCFWISKRASNFLFFFFALANLIICVVPSSMFILNQAISSLSLNWLLLHYIFLGAELKISKVDYSIIFLSLIILFRSHESQLIWSVFIVATYFLITFNSKIRKTPEGTLIHKIIFIFSLMHFFFAYFWQKNHPVDQSIYVMYSNIQNLVNLDQLSQGNIRLAVLSGLSVITVFFIGIVDRKLKRSDSSSFYHQLFIYSFIFVFSCLTFLSIYFSISVFNNLSTVDPFREFLYRFLIPFGSVFFMGLSAFFWLRSIFLSSIEKNMLVFTLSIGLFSASLWQIGNNINWTNFQMVTSQALVNSKNFLVDPSEVKILLIQNNLEYLYKYSCNWSWPVYGLTLQHSRNVEKLFLPQDGFIDWFDISDKDQGYVTLPFVKFKTDGFFIFNSIINKCSISSCKIGPQFHSDASI